MIHWNADPYLFHVGQVGVRYYSFFLFLGIVTSAPYLHYVFKKYGDDKELVWPMITYLVLGGMIGARLVHCLFYVPEYYLYNPIDILKVWRGGLASHGGFLGSFFGVWLLVRKHPKLNFLSTMDLIIGPCIYITSLIRWGNLFNSEIYGDQTDVPWSFVFQKVDNVSRHPVQIYEALAYLLIACMLIVLVHKKFHAWKKGSIFAIAIVVTCIFRFLIEFFKNETESSLLNTGQYLSLAFIVGGVLLWLGLQKRAK